MNDSLDPILQQEEQQRLRKQLIWRLGVAAVLVTGVLALLSWMEKAKESRPQITSPTARDIRIASPIATIASAPQQASAVQASEPARLPTEPASAPASAVAATLPGRPATISQAPASERKAPATPQPAKAVAPYLPAPEQLAATSRTASHDSGQVPASPLPGLTAKRPPPATSQPLRYPPAVSTPNGYTVQAGVFLHASNAEKLLAQVQAAGVPAYLETRVKIGPFPNKAEAETAVRKLRRAGIEPVLKTN